MRKRSTSWKATAVSGPKKGTQRSGQGRASTFRAALATASRTLAQEAFTCSAYFIHRAARRSATMTSVSARLTIRMSNTTCRWFASAFVSTLLLIPSAPIVGAQPDKTSTAATVVERGRFRFFDTKQPQGEETYEITSDNNALIV